MSDRDASAVPQAVEAAERRRIQRFLAQRRGQPGSGVMIGDERIELRDISVDGFAIAAETPAGGRRAFRLRAAARGVPDRIRGRAQAVNFIAASGQAGCRFRALGAMAPSAARLADRIGDHERERAHQREGRAAIVEGHR